jgi:hypothetical protein
MRATSLAVHAGGGNEGIEGGRHGIARSVVLPDGAPVKCGRQTGKHRQRGRGGERTRAPCLFVLPSFLF